VIGAILLGALPLSAQQAPAPSATPAMTVAFLATPEVSKAVNEKLAQLDKDVKAAQSSADNAWMLVSAALVFDDDGTWAGALLRRPSAAEKYPGDYDAELRADGADYRDVGAGWLQFVLWRQRPGDRRIRTRISAPAWASNRTPITRGPFRK